MNQWTKVSISGYFWYGQDFFLGSQGEKKFLSLINKCKLKLYELTNIINQFDGSWSIKIEANDFKICAVDRVSSRKLFYKKCGNSIEISNKISEFRNFFQSKVEINKHFKSYYIENNCSPIGKTLYKNIFTIPPGSFLTYKKGIIKIFKYSSFHARKKYTSDNDIEMGKYNLLNIMDKLIKTLKHFNPKNIYVPLSGGMDSRLIAYALAQNNNFKNNVICYTYGQSEKNPEAMISKKVANKLGLNWVFIEYRDRDWFELRQNFNETVKDLNIASSFSNLQEHIAVRRLVDKYGKGIFIPGFCLDAPAGAHLYRGTNYYKNFLKKSNIENEYILSDKSLNYEYCFLLTRMSGGVIPTVNSFKYKNSDFIMPFWFNDIFDFWYSLSYEARDKRKLFSEVVNKIYSKSNTRLDLIPYANQSFNKKGIGNQFLSFLKYLVHQFYSISFIKPIIRNYFLKKAITKSNKKNDYLGIYKFCKKDHFNTELEFEHYDKRVAEICFNHLVEKVSNKQII